MKKKSFVWSSNAIFANGLLPLCQIPNHSTKTEHNYSRYTGELSWFLERELVQTALNCIMGFKILNLQPVFLVPKLF